MNEPSKSLRSRALAMLSTSLEEAERIPADEVPKLLHELQVHQMELEIQNEELRQAQIELAHSRDRYSDLYEFAPVGYLTLDQQGVIEQANLTAATMLKVDREKLVGRKFSDFVSDESQDIWHLHRRDVFAGEKATACELVMTSRYGLSALFQIRSIAFVDEQGRLKRFRMAIADDTEKRIAFNALKRLNIGLDESLSKQSSELERNIEQVRLLSEAMAHLGEGVMITEDGLDWPGPQIVYVNHAMCKMSGYDAEELIGKTPRILQRDATDTESLKMIRHELRMGNVCNIELVNYHKDGTPYDVELFITPLFDTVGNRTHFVSIQRDVTRRKRLAEDLRREHEVNRNILETSQSVTLVLDTEAKIVEFNPYLEKITGWKYDEVKGRDWFETFLPDADRVAINRVFQNALAGKITQGIVNPILTKSGQQRYIEWFNAPLTDSNGCLMGVLCTGQDVTVRREMESHIVEAANEERRRIGTDLHDGVGQELTGLSMIAESLSVALTRESRPEARIADKIKAGLLRALDQVRALSRGMNPVDIDAEGLMSALSSMSEQLSEMSGIRCSFQCAQPVLVRDNSTATQLFRIAQEATSNAIRHAQPGVINISLDRKDDRVILRILDDGSGIKSNDTSQSGMGLRTMSYRANMIQGELAIREREGGGTEVICSVHAHA